MPKAEMKQIWQHTNEVAVNTLSQGTISVMPSIINGQSAQGRIGTSINAQGLHIKGAMYNNSTQESYVRLVVYGFNGSVDPYNNFFRNAGQNTVGAISSVNGLDAMYYPINKIDLHVYHDRVFKLGGSTTGAAASNTKMFSKFIKFGGRKITFKANTSGVGNQDWQYGICWIASDANDDTSTGTTVEVSMLERFYFKDA